MHSNLEWPRSRGRVVSWLFAPALVAVAVLTACSGAAVSEEQFTALSEQLSEVSTEQRTLVREVATLQREVGGLSGGENVVALAAAEHGAPAAAEHGAPVVAEHSAPAAAVAAPAAAHGADAAPHFTYSGATGPDVWGTLSQDWEICGTGSSQSPVNIKIGDSTPIGLNDVVFNYQPSDVTLINNGHTIQGNVQPGSTIVVDGESYDLLQFHFHEPSEHELDGSPAALEAHFVHRKMSAQVEEFTASTLTLGQLADDLKAQVAVFRLEGDSAGVRPARVESRDEEPRDLAA